MLVFKYILRLESLLWSNFIDSKEFLIRILTKEKFDKDDAYKILQGVQETRVSLNPLIILYTPFEHNL